MLTDNTATSIANCISEAKGKEICGYILANKEGESFFYLVENLSNERFTSYVSKFDFNRLTRYCNIHNYHIKAFLHSHYTSLEMSRQDFAAKQEDTLPWIIVKTDNNKLCWKVYE